MANRPKADPEGFDFSGSSHPDLTPVGAPVLAPYGAVRASSLGPLIHLDIDFPETTTGLDLTLDDALALQRDLDTLLDH